MDFPMTGKAPKEYLKEYQAEVMNTDDPEKLMRVQVRVMGLMDNISEQDLPWAEYKLPVGFGYNEGGFIPAQRGDWVWVTFPYDGDTRRPRIDGVMHFCPDSKPNMPHEAWNGDEKYSHKRLSPQLTPTPAGYHRDVVFSKHGVLVEIVKDTSEFRVTQKSSGSAVEIDREGNITAHSENNLYASAKNNTEIDVGKDLKARVAGETTINVEGKTTVVSKGKIDLDGGSGDLSGNVTMICKCPFTGTVHVDYSNEVKSSRG